MSDITLSSAVRSNLLSLQNTAKNMATTQERLATGNKVNSALDNPTNFFTAASLTSRSNDLGRLLDSVSNAIQTLEAADNGITAITKLVESAQATALQALQSAKASMSEPTSESSSISPGTGNGTNSTGMAIIDEASSFNLNTGGGTTTTINVSADASIDEVAAAINAETGTTDIVATVVESGGTYSISLENLDGTNGATVDTFTGDGAALGLDTAIAAGATDAGTTINTDPVGTIDMPLTTLSADTMSITVDGLAHSIALDGTESLKEIAEKITDISGLEATIEADGTGQFKLNIEGDDVTDFNFAGTTATALGINGDQQVDSVQLVSEARSKFETEYNDLLEQINDLGDDASYNGNNLLDDTDLKVIFNEDASSSLTIKGINVSASGLGITQIPTGDFQENTSIEDTLDVINNALLTLRSEASTFGSNLSVVQTRQDFTQNMMNTLEVGAANLVLADINEEGANMLALQTRQSLSTTALSMASESEQAVLQLF